MKTNWIYKENLWPLLKEVGRLIGYEMDPDDEVAIEYGIKYTDSEDDRWFEYAFENKDKKRINMKLSEESVVSTNMVSFSCDDRTEEKIDLLISLSQTYTLIDRNRRNVT